jgi:hypothetical protein
MEEKKTTINDLAIMVKKGFDETAKQIDVDKRFDKIEARLDRIENILLKNHEERIKRLENALVIKS